MTADTDIGFGADFLRGVGTPLVYTTVGQVIDMTLPELSRDAKDATHYKSPDRWREYIGGLRDTGEVSVTVQFADPTDLGTLMGDLQADTPVAYRIEFPDATTWSFTGLVTKAAPVVPLEERMTCEFAIKLSGKPEFLV